MVQETKSQVVQVGDQRARRPECVGRGDHIAALGTGDAEER